jgi:hypothetical protein
LVVSQTSANDVVALYVQLLMAARLESEARRECRTWFGATKGDAVVRSVRAALPARVRTLAPVENPAWWVAP